MKVISHLVLKNKQVASIATIQMSNVYTMPLSKRELTCISSKRGIPFRSIISEILDMKVISHLVLKNKQVASIATIQMSNVYTMPLLGKKSQIKDSDLTFLKMILCG
jgi:hypothetical protein